MAAQFGKEYSDELIYLLREHWEFGGYHLLKGPLSQKGMLEMLDEGRAGEELDQLSTFVPFSLEGRRVLEIGSGSGAGVLVGRQRGFDLFGIEPGPGVRVGRQLLADRGVGVMPITCAEGEHLPFRDQTFDVVCSFQVLEHTRHPESVLDETVRVLRPGGYFVHVFPNYGSLWEGHYGVLWIPHLPKGLARLYLLLLRQDLAVLEDLQLVTHEQVAAWARRHPEVRIVDWGLGLWEKRMRTLEFSEWAYLSRLKAMLRWLHRLRLVSLVVTLGRVLHLETPIVLVGVKLQTDSTSR